MRKFIIFLYVILIRTGLTFFCNIIYWILHLKSLNKSIEEKRKLKSYAEYMYGIRKLMKRHVWTTDPLRGLIDWSPWPLTMIARDFHDDCDGAARVARWMCKYCQEIEFAHEYIIIEKWQYKTAHVIVFGKMKSSIKWFCFSNDMYHEANGLKAVKDVFEKDHKDGYDNPVYYKLR